MSEPTPIASSTVEYMRPIPAYTAREPRQRYWLHALLLLLTCFTTLVMGARMQYNFQQGQPALSIGDDSVPYFPAGLDRLPPCQTARRPALHGDVDVIFYGP